MPVVLSLIGSDGFYTHLPDINENLLGILDVKRANLAITFEASFFAEASQSSGSRTRDEEY